MKKIEQILSLLRAEAREMTYREIAERLHVDRSYINKLCKKMQADGLVRLRTVRIGRSFKTFVAPADREVEPASFTKNVQFLQEHRTPEKIKEKRQKRELNFNVSLNDLILPQVKPNLDVLRTIYYIISGETTRTNTKQTIEKIISKLEELKEKV